MRRPPGLLLSLVSMVFLTGFFCCGTSNFEGTSTERCDPDAYRAHCEGPRTLAQCGGDVMDPLDRHWVYRRDCDYDTEVCVEEGGVVGCAVDPPERCAVQYEKRCVAGLEQTCDANDLEGRFLYWKQYPGFSCP